MCVCVCVYVCVCVCVTLTTSALIRGAISRGNGGAREKIGWHTVMHEEGLVMVCIRGDSQ